MRFDGAYGFYPIVDTVDWMKRLLPCGVKTLQLRIKDQSGAELERSVAEAVEMGREYGCQVVINDYWQLALKHGAAFLHLGQEDLDAADVAAIEESGIALGISTHSPEELDRALTCRVAYVALGPVYETTLKKMPWAPQGLERVKRWKEMIDCPLVAIGGLTLERAPGVLAAGADSIAMVSDVTLNRDPEARVAEWLDLFSARAAA